MSVIQPGDFVWRLVDRGAPTIGLVLGGMEFGRSAVISYGDGSGLWHEPLVRLRLVIVPPDVAEHGAMALTVYERWCAGFVASHYGLDTEGARATYTVIHAAITAARAVAGEPPS